MWNYVLAEKTKLVENARQQALAGFYSGLIQTSGDSAYFARCTSVHRPTGSCILFTRDTGHHASGWFKNPDYERCWHLSISFRDPETGEFASQNHKVAGEWITLFYGDDRRWVWAEPPYSPKGKITEVWHYRLFCDEGWQPIKPRGEVYTRVFTEKGWKSFSEIHGEGVAEFSMGDPS